MQIIIDIPDELVPTVLSILEHKKFPEDDGMTDVVIMKDLDISVSQFVRAENIVDNITTRIKIAAYLAK